MAEFDRHDEAGNPDITEGYANPDITKPEEIVEEPQEAQEVWTGSYFTMIVADSKMKTLKRHSRCSRLCHHQSHHFYVSFFRTTLSPEFLIFLWDLQQPQF